MLDVAAVGGPGRRWTPVAWFASEECGPSLDRLMMACTGHGVCSQIFDRSNEYRYVWDLDRGMWRLDRRRHADGG